jgi:hypothetical protein
MTRLNDHLISVEENKVRRLGILADVTQAILMQSDLSYEESLSLIDRTKEAALVLFPDKESVFDLIYVPRFRRIINERFQRRNASSKIVDI